MQSRFGTAAQSQLQVAGSKTMQGTEQTDRPYPVEVDMHYIFKQC